MRLTVSQSEISITTTTKQKQHSRQILETIDNLIIVHTQKRNNKKESNNHRQQTSKPTKDHVVQTVHHHHHLYSPWRSFCYYYFQHQSSSSIFSRPFPIYVQDYDFGRTTATCCDEAIIYLLIIINAVFFQHSVAGCQKRTRRSN